MFKQLTLPFISYKFLISQLTIRDIKARYKQSYIGYAWILVNPLLQLLVYSFVFSVVLHFQTTNIPYPIFLFAGLLPWIYFQNVLTSATQSLVDNSDLLRKIYFPREVFTYSLILSKSVDFFFASLLLLAFMLIYHVSLSINVFYIIPIFITQMILMAGIGLIFSSFNLFYRDFQYLINLLLMLWMYLTPIVYPLNLVPSKYLGLYKLNPMVGIIEGYRFAFFNTSLEIRDLIWSVVFSLAIFLLSYYIFKKSEKSFADIA